VAAIALIDVASPAALLASGAAAGVALVLRPPLALALFVLVPAVVIARRAPERRDIARGLAWLALAGTPLLALAYAAHLAGHDNLFSEYWHAQVLASLTGTRSDGDGSHWAVLNGMMRTFWPALPLLVAALYFVVTRQLWRQRFVSFLLLWTVAVLGGLSLGKRHLPYHAWVAYPAMLLLCGLALEHLASQKRVAAHLAKLRWLGPSLVVVGIAFTVAFPVLNRRSLCDTERAAPLIAALPNACAAIAVLSETGPYWNAANTVVDHLGRDVVFVTPQSLLAQPHCVQVVVAPKALAVWPGARPLLLGKRVSFYALDATP